MTENVDIQHSASVKKSSNSIGLVEIDAGSRRVRHGALCIPESYSAEAFAAVLRKEPPDVFTPTTIALYACCAIGFLCSTMNGYDASLINGLLQNSRFKEFFGGSNKGVWVGIVAFLYQLGSLASIPFAGLAMDTWGRRKGIFIGVCVIIAGIIIQGTSVYSHSLKQFMAGRFLLGFGANLVGAGGPIWVIELSHPAHRGVITALFNNFWFVGSILSGGAVRGALSLSGNSTWLLPVWFQLLCSVIIATFILFLPESPRWLFVNGQKDRAKSFLIKYHGQGKPNSEWVQLQMTEYEGLLNLRGSDKRWWDFRPLFRTRASRYRLYCNMAINVFGQWTGNALVGILLSAVLDTAGVSKSIEQTNLNLGLACLQLVMATIGSFLVDSVGRRPLLIVTNATLAVIWVCMTIATALYEKTGSHGSARAILAFIFLFDIVFATGITPLQVLYPVEVIPYETRAKGVAFGNIPGNAANLVNQFAWPIAFANIGWKTYIILAVWCLVQAVLVYLFIPETRNCTLEELDHIFAAENPRNASLKEHNIHQ